MFIILYLVLATINVPYIRRPLNAFACGFNCGLAVLSIAQL